MNKRKIVILIFAVIAIMFLNKLIKYNTFYSTGLQGKLIFKNHETCLYDFTTNKLTYLDVGDLMPLFMGKSDEILSVKDNNIYKYNDLTVYVENEKITKVVFYNGYEINYN